MREFVVMPRVLGTCRESAYEYSNSGWEEHRQARACALTRKMLEYLHGVLVARGSPAQPLAELEEADFVMDG
jgi:hypothetical protein